MLLCDACGKNSNKLKYIGHDKFLCSDCIADIEYEGAKMLVADIRRKRKNQIGAKK